MNQLKSPDVTALWHRGGHPNATRGACWVSHWAVATGPAVTTSYPTITPRGLKAYGHIGGLKHPLEG